MSIINTALKIKDHIPCTKQLINRIATNSVCNSIKPRPNAFSLWSHVAKPEEKDEQGPVGEYTTWPMLTDKRYSARHLPPADQEYIDRLPKDVAYNPENNTVGDITALFAREGEMKTGRSSMLFMFFAQWFTDSVLRVDSSDRRKNTSNHNVDLCQIYGLTEESANILRSKEKGKLKSQKINGEEYLDYLGEVGGDGKWKVKDCYKGLPYTSEKILNEIVRGWDDSRKHKLYATGLERGNSSIGYVAISTIFMREHNRLCDELSGAYPSWDDERLFQTARMINTVILLKLVIQDYINHITGGELFYLDHTFAEEQNWYRTPWISIEFDLLYRWHGLIPDVIKFGDQEYGHTQYRMNNGALEDIGLVQLIDAVSKQNAGTISLKNVPTFMLGAEYATLKMGRDFRLCSYNKYRELYGLDKLSSFDELTHDSSLAAKLKELYKDIDNVEFVIGIFAQSGEGDALFGDLLNTMVAYDAFTQIYTNPLLSKNIYTTDTLSEVGMEIIKQTNSFQSVLDRNNTSSFNAKAIFSL
ncbi:peroxidase family protein [Agarilytica rhodophyticola]|uniref:peroxidase family protein n=1 Tax=Agarilytica rhodophyticola TaxID=1737490 RepID=UPI000B34314E|nr:peroxidase family protein [Agarilytica rhodophyticola]